MIQDAARPPPSEHFGADAAVGHDFTTMHFRIECHQFLVKGQLGLAGNGYKQTAFDFPPLLGRLLDTIDAVDFMLTPWPFE